MCPAVPTTTDFRLPTSDFRRTSEVLPPPLCPLPFVSARPLLPSAFLLFRGRLAATRSPLAFADALEDLDQPEFHLAHLHVDADHLHLHLVAEAVGLVRVLAMQHVRVFDEPVVIVRHR